MNLTERLITFDEGIRSEKYLDSRGIPTIGKGHNLNAAPPCPAVVSIQLQAGLPVDDRWTDAAIEAQYQHDLGVNCSWLWTKPWWAQVSECRQAALNDFAFNLGAYVAQGFGTFLGLCASGDWEAAATDLGANPKLVAEEPKRIARLQKIMRTDTFPVLPA